MAIKQIKKDNINDIYDYFHLANHAFYLRQDKNVPHNSVIFIGDSHVQGLAVSAITNNAFNFGIGRDDSLKLSERYHTYTAIDNAKCVVIQIGINDILNDVNADVVTNNYVKILQASNKNTNVLINYIFPVSTVLSNHQRINSMVETLNAHLLSLNKHRNVHLLNINNYLQSANNSYISDGLHLSATAYDYWIIKLRQKLNLLGCQ